MGKALSSYWTVAETHYSQEQRAAHHVERQGFEFYLPQFLRVSRVGEKRTLMFPGYIFIKITAQWRSLMGTRGISRIFVCSEKPSRIPEREIKSLMDRHDHRGFVSLYPRLADGSSVKITEDGGALVGLVGVLQSTSASDRCLVLLSVMGKSITKELDRRVLVSA